MPRGRPIGSGTQGLEPCPVHPDGRVVKNGRYGKASHRRQMFRCFPPSGAAPHNFAGSTPRLVAAVGTCAHCENRVEAHEGPRAAQRYDFPVAQAAEALVMVGQGVSYTEAAARVRVRNRRGELERGSQLVGNWVEVLGPVVCAERAEAAWPETVVLDSTWFMVTNPRTGNRSRAFSVLGAYGYPHGPKRGRTWALKAVPKQDSTHWQALLEALPGEPALVVCDDDTAVHKAVRAVWPHTFVKLCEHHLREGARKEMRRYGTTTYGSTEMALLNEAFHSPEGWKAFKAGVDGVGVETWIADHDAMIGEQVSRRAGLPDHHSTAALDEVLAKVREFMEPRAFCYRNAARTNRLLELVRLRLNRADDPVAYAAAIRAHLDANNGRLTRQRLIDDRRGSPSLR